jgi:hypothetical protein
MVPISVFAAEPEHVSTEKFVEYATLPMGTMRYSECLGVSEGKAYVAVHEMSLFGKKWSKSIYWVESEKLDPELVEQLTESKQ